MDRRTFTTWIEWYEAAWRTAGTDVLAQLFTDEATYTPSPFEDAIVGLAAITEFWDAERRSHDEAFTLTAALVAVEGDTGVARIEVVYGDPPARYRDLWVFTLAADGRCRAFEEWPFFPGQPRVAP